MNVSRLSFYVWCSLYQSISLKNKKEIMLPKNYRALSWLNIINACISAYGFCVFSLKCQVHVLTLVTVLHFWQLRYKMLARLINLSFWHCVKDNVVLQALHPSSNTKSKSTILRPLKGEVGYELSTSKLANSDSSSSDFSLSNYLLSLMVLLNRPFFFPFIHGWQCYRLSTLICNIPQSNDLIFAFPKLCIHVFNREG